MYFGGLYLFVLLSCTPSDTTTTDNNGSAGPTTPTIPTSPTGPIVPPFTPVHPGDTIHYLALGDSYTIGQSVCASCSFPAQLKNSLSNQNNPTVLLKTIATTGWTTADLKNAINNQTLNANYDLVTLLIGVNNQYQNKPFSQYEEEFPQLLNKAIALAQGDPNNVIVVSIPDYAYTPYGQNTPSPSAISTAIDKYNAFAKNYSEQKGVIFVDITTITRRGLDNPNLVCTDGLHPSELAYSQFVSLILPKSIAALQN